jgi:carnitine O-acetyltransferase
VVFDNAYAGFMGEHSVMDGTPTVRLCDEVLNMLHDKAFDHGTPSAIPAPTPQPLDWEVSPTITKAIADADKSAKELIESQELGFLLTSYGKAAIKKFGVSPDSWAQMIVQLAYRRLLGDAKRTGGTYEAATTRRFYKGRTEAIRVVTSESDAWVNSMDIEEVSNDERKKLFEVAAKKHISLAKVGGMGQGVDRHMLGMPLLALSDASTNHCRTGLRKLLKEGEELPALYSDPVFIRSSNWVLSTSAIFSQHFPVYGWGEVGPPFFRFQFGY